MNRYVRPICFGFEPDIVSVFALASFGAAGAPTLNTNYSKGLCNLARNSITLTGDIASGNATVSNVSSYAGLYIGMGISGVGIQAGSTIAALTPGSGTLTLSATATATTPTLAITVAGGQYTLTYGSQYTPFKRLDAYVRLLALSHNWDESGTQGGASTGAIVPVAPAMFLVANNISTSTLANLVLQFGYYTGSGVFTAKDPASGEVVRIYASFTRSTAI